MKHFYFGKEKYNKMLSEDILDTINNPPEGDQDLMKESEEVVKITPENIQTQIFNEKWTQRKNTYLFLKSEFSSNGASKEMIEFFNAKISEMLSEKNVIALEELLFALREYLINYQVQKSLIQHVVTFFSGNIPNRKNEKSVNEIIQICSDLNQEIVFTTISKKIEVEQQSLQQIHILGYLLMLLEKIDGLPAHMIKGLLLKLKVHLNNANQKVRKMSLDAMKILVKLVRDDFFLMQKHIFDGIKEAQMKELQIALSEDKKPSAVVIVENGGALAKNPSAQNLSQFHHANDFEHPQLRLQARYENTNINSLRQLAPVSEIEYPPIEVRDGADIDQDYSQKRPKPFRIDPPKEPVMPDKLPEIIHLRTIDERINVLHEFKNQLSGCKKFGTLFPSHIFPLLINELKEANYLLYSVVLEIFSLLLNKSKNKQNINQWQVKQIVSIIAIKYNLKPGINPVIFEIIDSFVKRAYIQTEILVKFVLDEIIMNKARNLRQCFFDWLVGSFPRLEKVSSYKDFSRKLKTIKEAKGYIQTFQEAFKHTPARNFKDGEVIGFLMVRLLRLAEEEKQIQTKVQIKECLTKLKETIVNLAQNPSQEPDRDGSEDSMSEEEIEKNKLIKKLNTILSQIINSTEHEIQLGRELYIHSIFEIIEQFEKLDSLVAQKIAKTIAKLIGDSPVISPKAAVETIILISILFEEESIKIEKIVFSNLLKTFGIQKLIEILDKLYQRPSMKRNYQKINACFIEAINGSPEKENFDVIRNAFEVLDQGKSQKKRFMFSFLNFFGEKIESLGKKTNVIKNLPDKKNNVANLNQNQEQEIIIPPKFDKPNNKSDENLFVSNVDISRHIPKNKSESKLWNDHVNVPQPSTLENYKHCLFSQFEFITSISLLRETISKISNNYKLLNSLINSITFKEISKHLEQILNIFAKSKENNTQIIQDFVVLVLSLLTETDREKFVVLILTYFSKFKSDYSDCLGLFLSKSKNPYLCYKYAFNLVNKQFEDRMKIVFLFNTFEFMIRKFDLERPPLEDPQFCFLLEMIIMARNVKSYRLPEDKYEFENIMRLENLGSHILNGIFKQNDKQKIFDRFEKELSNSGRLYNFFCDNYKKFEIMDKAIQEVDNNKLHMEGLAYENSQKKACLDEAKILSAKKKVQLLDLEAPKIKPTPLFHTKDNSQDINQNGYLNNGEEDTENEANSKKEASVDPPAKFKRTDNSKVELSNEKQVNKIHNEGSISKKSDSQNHSHASQIHIKNNYLEFRREALICGDNQKSENRVSESSFAYKKSNIIKPVNDNEKSANELTDRSGGMNKQKVNNENSPEKINQQQERTTKYENKGYEAEIRIARSIDKIDETNLQEYVSYKSIRAQRKNHISSADRKMPAQVGETENLNKVISLENKKRNFVENKSVYGQKTNVFRAVPLKNTWAQSLVQKEIEKSTKNENIKFNVWKNNVILRGSSKEKLISPNPKALNENAQLMIPQTQDFRNQKLNKTIGSPMGIDYFSTDLVKKNQNFPVQMEEAKPAAKKTDKYVNEIFKIDGANSEKVKIPNSISTQTEFTRFDEEERRKLQKQISELVEKTTHMTNQLYILSQTNDELRNENKYLQSQKEMQTQNGFRELEEKPLFEKFDQNFAEYLIEGRAISRSFLDKLVDVYFEHSEDDRERMLFDFKFYVFDNGVIEHTHFENYSRLIHFIVKLSIRQNLADSKSNSTATKLIHNILDLLLKNPSKQVLLGILMHVIGDQIPKYNSSLTDETVLYMKLIMKIASRVLDLFITEVSKTSEEVLGKSNLKIAIFKIFIGIFRVFTKNPPEQLCETTQNLEFYDDLFKEIRRISDGVAKLDISATKSFLKFYKIQHSDKAFIEYLENLLNQLDN